MIFYEAKLSAKERRELPDSEFGIPSQRRFPIHDRAHTIAAVRMFNHVDKEHEAELARNIIRKMKQFDIPFSIVSKENRLYNYIPHNAE